MLRIAQAPLLWRVLGIRNHALLFLGLPVRCWDSACQIRVTDLEIRAKRPVEKGPGLGTQEGSLNPKPS